MGVSLHPRLKLDIGWRHLFWGAFGPPVSKRRAAAATQEIEARWPERSVVIGLSVRTLFDAILKTLALPKAEPVIMSAINIDGMAKIVDAHGLSVRCVDIDPETMGPQREILDDLVQSGESRIVVTAQLFGGVSGLHRTAAPGGVEGSSVLLIEDAAQAFAGTAYNGDADADITLFSFGPIKRASALGGGVAVFRDKALADRVKVTLSEYPVSSETWFRMRALKYLMLKSLNTPLTYGLLWRGLKLAGRDPDKVIGSSARGFSGGDLLAAIRRSPPRRLIALLARRLGEEHEGPSRARALASVVPGFPGSGAETNFAWVAPIRVADVAGTRERLLKRGFDATRGATSLRCLDPDTAPEAARLMQELLYVPHPAHLKRGAQMLLKQALNANFEPEGVHHD